MGEGGKNTAPPQTDLVTRLNDATASKAALADIEARLTGQLDADLCELHPQAVEISKALISEIDRTRADAIAEAKAIAAAAGVAIEIKPNQICEKRAAIPCAQSYGENKANFVKAMAQYLSE